MTPGVPHHSPSCMIHPPPQTQAETGKYTKVAKRPAKMSHEPNLARSAIAPEMSATVMIAKVAPKVAPTSAALPPSDVDSDCRPKSENGLPAKNGLPSPMADMLKP